ncbi:hypothetical protein MARPO_0127s0034 [Marchantia polymorpha]|uniref:Uncharacterized protein n=1 Tax=Marchantia polymorpha TaxID=3197 RepID=A0A2R6W8S7_MARPO|nr:hypothetical protein MARPO_0127s0034 [Marchantia polymorpha]|eukprot:PTQ30251.1 hypothetical protein MARPO_0127s0034 [Marchantia polymorpha]
MRPSGGSGKEATNVRSLRVCLCHVRAGNEYEAPPETRPPWVCQESSLYRNVLQPDVSPPFYGVPQPDKMRTSKEPFDNRKITKELPYNQIDSRASDSRNEVKNVRSRRAAGELRAFERERGTGEERTTVKNEGKMRARGDLGDGGGPTACLRMGASELRRECGERGPGASVQCRRCWTHDENVRNGPARSAASAQGRRCRREGPRHLRTSFRERRWQVGAPSPSTDSYIMRKPCFAGRRSA